MLTVILPYERNPVGLSQLLVSLQPQLHPDDDIYIIDSSPDRSGVEVAKYYGSTRSYIFVEVSQKKGVEAIKLGLQSMRENKQEGALIMSSRAVIPVTCIANLKKAMLYGYDVLFFKETHPVLSFDPNFSWYSPLPSIQKVRSENRLVYYMKNVTELRKNLLYGEITTENIVILPDY